MLSTEWSCFIPGEPAARAEKVVTIRGRGRTFTRIADKGKPSDYKAYLKSYIADSAPQRLLDGALRLELTAYLPKPKSAPKSRIWPVKKPDLSNLLKCAEDCLRSIVIVDDALIVQQINEKRYAGEDCMPGLWLKVSEI